jgi:hypothetical protein
VAADRHAGQPHSLNTVALGAGPGYMATTGARVG